MKDKLIPVGTLLVPNEYQKRRLTVYSAFGAWVGIVVAHVKVPWGTEHLIFLNNGKTVRQNSSWIYDLFDPVKT